jgi:N-acetylornithine carbamoyltransferase
LLKVSSIRHFKALVDFSDKELHSILGDADYVKKNNIRSSDGAGKMLGLLFFNPSLRTKISFETAAYHLGAGCTVISPGQGSWSLETDLGVKMDGNKTEHIKEAIEVLSQYCDTIGVRAFSTLKDREKDYQENLLNMIVNFSKVPIINMESAMSHPCQAMADWMTLRELFGVNNLRNKKLVLSWAPHPHALPMAVPYSVMDMATRSGVDLSLVCPEEMLPDGNIIAQMEKQSDASNSRFEIFHSQEKGFHGANVIYAKSWASPLVYENPELEAELRTHKYNHWTITHQKMSLTNNAYFMHCLPVRRNVVVNDDVLDSSNSVHIQQAANRLHVQKAILRGLWSR